MAIWDSTPAERFRVAVLAGGPSEERDVSRKSGDSVARALKQRGHRVDQIDPSEVDPADLPWNQFDVAFLALHGRYGEDGQIQDILDQLGIAYTGSGGSVSRLAFSKSASKERFIQAGVPTPSYVLIHEADDAARIQHQARKLGYPLVVKPDQGGSSLGVSVVESPDQLPQALSRCFHYDAFGLLEPAIAGTEWTLGLLDGRPLPLIEITTPRPFFDYHAKYHEETTGYRFQFDVPTHVREAIENAGFQAAEALGTTGLVRVDLRLDRFHRPWVLEVNTIPGLSENSLIPKAAAELGLSLGELSEHLIRSCLSRAASSQARPGIPGSWVNIRSQAETNPIRDGQ